MDKKIIALKTLLWMFCAANVILGLVAFGAGPFAADAAQLFYGAHVTLTPQLNYVIRMLGVFVLAMGILGGVAAKDPVRNKSIINVIILTLGLRVVQRLLCAAEIQDIFGISIARNWANIAFFLAIAVALFVLKPKE